MAKCYYCKDEVTNDDLTEIDGALVRVCADCQDFIDKYGTALLDSAWFSEDANKTKKYIRSFDKKVPNPYNNSKTK